MSTIDIIIVTPSKHVFEGTCLDVYVPSSKGQTGLLTEHAHLVSQLGAGVITIHQTEGDKKMALRGGFFEVSDNKVMILADQAAFATDIDVDRLKAQREELETQLLSPDVSVQQREELFATRDWLQAQAELI
ncbi:MAG: ATP synthase F1 subunit epsilon [Bdellovibrionota bacterium]